MTVDPKLEEGKLVVIIEAFPKESVTQSSGYREEAV